MLSRERIEDMNAALEALPATPWHVFEEPFDNSELSICSQDGPCNEECPTFPHCHRCVVYSMYNRQCANFISNAPVWMKELLGEVSLLRKFLEVFIEAETDREWMEKEFLNTKGPELLEAFKERFEDIWSWSKP